ncbi:thioredoxin family protein [Maritimibacter alexandrii]|uniref:thioredoxin family protein n=1 Tax=Maritimibacter alexandrii TaxID=2570355 RepID=UPI001109DE5C|nr:thioredoxin family protein [Maritimibacter alexandrii]
MRALAALFAIFAALPALAADLVMVEQPGCAYCRQWDAELSEIYPKTPEGQAAPLVRVQLVDVQKGRTEFDFARPVNFTPTFVLVEDGAELARIEGYPGEDFFWGLLGMMLKAQIGFDPATQADG